MSTAICSVSIEYTCRTPSPTNGSLPAAAGSELRSRAVMVTVSAGGRGIGGTRDPSNGRT